MAKDTTNIKGVTGRVTQVTGAVVDVQFAGAPAGHPERAADREPRQRA